VHRPLPAAARSARLLLPLVAVGLAGAALAAEWSVTPRLGVRMEYDDNRRLSLDCPARSTEEECTPPTGTFGTVVDAAAQLAWATQVSTVSVTPRLRASRYQEDPDLLDSDDQYLDLIASTRSERARYGLDGNMSLETVQTSETIADQEGVSLRRRNVQIPRDQWRLRPSWSYTLSERNVLSLDANLTWVDYGSEGRTGAAGGYVDYNFYVANASLAHALTERDTISGFAYFSRYERDVLDSVTDSVGFQVGYELALTETLKGSVAVGLVRSDFSSDSQRIEVAGRELVIPGLETTEDGQLINASLTQTLERGSWSVTASRTLSPTGEGVLVTRDELRGNLTHGLSQRLEGRLGVLAFADSSVGGQGQRSDRDYARVELGLRYRLTPYWSVTGQYNYRYEKYDTNPDAADSNALWLTVNWQGNKWATSR
jgi:hypothetical protein